MKYYTEWIVYVEQFFHWGNKSYFIIVYAFLLIMLLNLTWQCCFENFCINIPKGLWCVCFSCRVFELVIKIVMTSSKALGSNSFPLYFLGKYLRTDVNFSLNISYTSPVKPLVPNIVFHWRYFNTNSIPSLTIVMLFIVSGLMLRFLTSQL